MTFSNLEFFRFLVQDDKLAIDLKLCIAITDILKMCACCFEWKMGEGLEKRATWGTDMHSTGASSVSYRQKKNKF